MSRLVAKLMLALLMLPTAGALYMVGMVIAFETLTVAGEVAAFAITSVVVLAYIAAYWLLLWRRSVSWTPRRISLTIGATAASLLIGSAIGFIGAAAVDASFGLFIASVLASLIWLLLTVLIWRETDAERMARLRAAGLETISCLGCGYNLTGLKHTTCPECGANPTIEELLAGQASRAERELTDAAAEPVASVNP